MNRRIKTEIIFGIAFVLLILAPVVRHYQLRLATGNYIAELKAQGEPMTLTQALPPPVPPEENSASILQEADASFDSAENLCVTNYAFGMTLVAPGKAMICSQQPDIRDRDKTNSWQKVGAAVVQNKKAFELLQQIIEKPTFDFQIKYASEMARIDYTKFDRTTMRKVACQLQTAALYDLHLDEAAMAVKNLRALLALVKAKRDDRLVMSELIRMAIAQIAFNVTWEVLQSPHLGDHQLAELQQDWMSLEFIRSQKNVLAMERVTQEISLAELRSSISGLGGGFSFKWWNAMHSFGIKTAMDSLDWQANVFRWRYWWSYPDETRRLKGYEVLLKTMRLAETNGSFQAALSFENTALDQLGISQLDDSSDDLHSMLSVSIVSLAKIPERVMRIEVAKQLAITAIALKRYQLKYQNYPDNLSKLTPELLRSIPVDPVDGKPLRYRKNTDGTFLLYSVGENGRDDGGDPTWPHGMKNIDADFDWQDRNARDWVWPQPATPAEIQRYYAAPHK